MRFLLLALLSPLLMAKVVDLGSEGHLYPIIEKDFLVVLKEGTKEVQKELTKEVIKKKIFEGLKSKVFASRDLPLCQEDNKYLEDNSYKVPVNLYNPAGRLYKKKGSLIVVENKLPVDICFISGKTDKEIDTQIKFYNSIVPKLSGQGSSCTFMVAEHNILQLDKKYNPKMFYPTNKGYEDTFGVKCFPTLIHLYKKKRYRFELKRDSLIKERK